MRGRMFQPRLKFASLEELNEWLEAECRLWAAMQPHPEQKDITVAQALEMERPALQPMLAPFDGFHETEHAVTGTCLISFDRNRYSVMATAVRRPVQVRAYADRIIVRCGDTVVAEHARHFGRERMILDPLAQKRKRPAGAGEEAGGASQWRAVPGLGVAAGADAPAPQAGQRRRGRPTVRAGPCGGADRWSGCG